MNTFSGYHPSVIFIYFAVVIAVNILFFDPVIYLVFFVGEAVFYCYVKGAGAGIRFLTKCFSFVAVCAVVNACVNHRGAGVLFYAGGLPVTVESLCCGVLAGILLTNSFLAFGCCHTVMTSEKLMSLTAKWFPSFSLVFSMVLGLVPKMKRDYKKLKENHMLVKDHKVQFGILSTLIGLSLEDSVDRGTSMRYRGYGGQRRTSIYVRRFRLRDGIVLVVIILLAAGGTVCYLISDTGLELFPYMEYQCTDTGLAAYVIFAVLFNIPMAINGKEELRWKRIVSKI